MSRLALLLILFASISGYVVATRGTQGRRSPAIVPNVNARPALVSHVGGVTRIVSPDALEHIMPDTMAPTGEATARLLWLGGRVGSATANGSAFIDPAGGVVVFDDRLQPNRPRLSLDGREVSDIAAAANGGWWIVDGSGHLLLVDARGEIVRDIRTPFSAPAIASTPDGARAWLARSPQRFGYSWDPNAPLLARLDNQGDVATRIGTALLPKHVMLQDLANAARVVPGQDRLYYVPFIRDEVVALDTLGDTLWVASRELPQSTREPRFEVKEGRVVIDYHPVNLGAALGPDGRLYVLSTSGFTTARSRLDAFDPASGRLLRSTELQTTLATIAVDAGGRVYLLDATRLLTGIAPAERERFPAFALATNTGDSIHRASLLGRVTLINLWASWCKPCRDEMPALDRLRRSVGDSAFAFLSINGDASPTSAEIFLRDVKIQMPFAIGSPTVTRDYHAPGLPYTVLVDREGRVVQRWLGYSGPEQIAAIRSAIQLELQRGATHSHAHMERPGS